MSSSKNSESSQEEFVLLLARHESAICAFIRASLPTAEHTTKVMQNVSLVAWKNFPISKIQKRILPGGAV